MSDRGRPNKPTKLKVLQGTDRKDRVNENEPKPKELQQVPDPPYYLDYYAKKEWNRAAAHLVEVGLLTEADLSTFQDYCECHAHCIRLNKKIRNEEYEFVTDSGYYQKRPIVSILKDFMDQKRKLANVLGLTPSARTKIEIDKPNDDKPTVEQILNGEV
ncbi:phage terminase small subunit P27 family [Natroniella acetigena]|uniref:phage terminase small subunit P27 family n=1 Tax=Natroniella acetigena TaxID=52004 RepID=UPI00200AEF37|nr:phage terminase small subunit P27 family [Natroniella acetigena]MCK8826396.1 phage terminase small subunit P27 family [Natroniella acetigena]